MEIPKLTIKVLTDQGQELLTLVIPADMLGRHLAWLGGELVALSTGQPFPTTSPPASKPGGKGGQDG